MAQRRFGSEGQPFVATANIFEVTNLPQKNFYHYDLSLDPEVRNPKRAFQIVMKVQREHAQIFTPQALYDGKKNLYISREITSQSGGVLSFLVSLAGIPGQRDAQGKLPRGTYEVRIVRAAAAVIKPSDLKSLLSGAQPEFGVETALNLLQLLIRAAPNLQFPYNARSYFIPVQSRTVGFLELWNGFFQSVRPTLGRMVINVDVSVGAMYRPCPLPEFAHDVLGGRRDATRLFFEQHDPELRKLRGLLKGVRVTIKPSRDPLRERSIQDIVSQAGLVRFESRDNSGQPIEETVENYYARVYNHHLRYPRAFGIKYGNPRSNIIIPSELCTIVPRQLFRKKIPPEITNAMVTFSTKKPEERLRIISLGGGQNAQFHPLLSYTQSPFMQDAGMTVSQQPMSIKGRLLAPPQINYLGGTKEARNGSWNLVGRTGPPTRFLRAKPIKAWGVVNFNAGQVSEELAKKFIDEIKKCCQLLGMTMPDPVCVNRADPTGGTAEKHLNTAGETIFNACKKVELLVVLLPDAAPAVRKAVKFWGDVRRGVATQCIRGTKFLDRDRNISNQYCNNVALKLNVRMGGSNSSAASQTMRMLREAPYMIVGVDVAHGGPGSAQASVAGLVFSYDADATEYVALSEVQNQRQEKIEDMRSMMLTALTQFSIKNGRPPVKIVVFRDGLSEGEYATVGTAEIQDIRAAIDELWKTAPASMKRFNILITFIVVGKRHHIRFFPTPGRGDKSGNCPAGFIADQGLSNPAQFDYYLLSHGGLLGTSRPAHYIVLLDDIFQNNVDNLQELSFSLCHVYASATRSVSIPAPVYYADLVCARGADFYFREELITGDGSTVSGGSQGFDLDQWKAGFAGNRINSNLSRRMYFI